MYQEDSTQEETEAEEGVELCLSQMDEEIQVFIAKDVMCLHGRTIEALESYYKSMLAQKVHTHTQLDTHCMHAVHAHRKMPWKAKRKKPCLSTLVD